MKKLLLVLTLLVLSAPSHAAKAFYKYDYISGLNRICVYDHIGSEVAITIAAHKLCPTSIDV